MSSTIASLPPATHQIPHKLEFDGAPDVPEIAFSELWQDKEEGITFDDVIDILNPLQHIPIVSSIYRMATEDDIGVGARVLGGTLFGGPLGLIGAGLTAIFEEISGDSVETHVASLWNSLTGDDEATSQVAAAVPDKAAIPAKSSDKQALAPAVTPRIEDDYAAAAAMPAPIAAATRPIAGGDQIAAIPTIAPRQTTAPIQLSPQPLSRPPVSVAPLSAVHRVNTRQPQTSTANHAAESQRIAAAINQAQRAQAGLLLASLGADRVDQTDESGDKTTAKQIQPFKAHPYLLPRGAPPQLISRAMEQALAKYQTTLQQRGAATTAASPRSVPAPVR